MPLRYLYGLIIGRAWASQISLRWERLVASRSGIISQIPYQISSSSTKTTWVLLKWQKGDKPCCPRDGETCIPYRQGDADTRAPLNDPYVHWIPHLWSRELLQADLGYRNRFDEKMSTGSLTQKHKPNNPTLTSTAISVVFDVDVDWVWEISTEFFWFFLGQGVSCNDYDTLAFRISAA